MTGETGGVGRVSVGAGLPIGALLLTGALLAGELLAGALLAGELLAGGTYGGVTTGGRVGVGVGVGVGCPEVGCGVEGDALGRPDARLVGVATGPFVDFAAATTGAAGAELR